MTTDHRIVLLQVQRSPVKIGSAPMRYYDPAPLVPVTSIKVDPRGVHGITGDGEVILDVHHRDHPQSRDPGGDAGILLMGTGDYRALRERYGDHLTNGIAGETILLDAPAGLAGGDLPDTVTVSTAAGPIELRGVRVAEPCVEFSRFCLGRPTSPVVDDVVKATLKYLDGGSRGYRSIAAASGTITVGDVISF
jgi:hypothetical protein